VFAAEAVTLPGEPLRVSVGPLGQCQSSYAGLGNDFYPPEGLLGDCGLFLAFPSAGNPAPLHQRVFGFSGIRGPGLSAHYTPVGQRSPTGTGTSSDPHRQVTVFKIGEGGEDYALIEETTSYVDGAAQFSSTYDVENVTGSGGGTLGLNPAPATSLRFQAIYAGDLLAAGEALGAGALLAGPPRLVGARNEAAGVLSGFVEAPAPSPPWASYASGCWDSVAEAADHCAGASGNDRGIWAAVRAATGSAPAFDDDIDPAALDGGAGVSWTDHLATPLQPGEHAQYAIVDRAGVPVALSVAPAAQTQTVGKTATITLTAFDSAGVPYAGRPIVYTIGETNPKSGSVLTNAAGVATVSYVGTAAGVDTLHAFLDLPGTGAIAARDPSATARLSWSPPAGAANSRFSIRGIRVTRDGSVTVILVPRQDGTTSVQVAAPTATVAGVTHGVRARHRCEAGQIRLQNACLPRMTVTGRSRAAGHAGVALKLLVRPSRGLARALARGRTVRLAVKVTYAARLGGKPTVERFERSAKGVPPARRRKTRH